MDRRVVQLLLILPAAAALVCCSVNSHVCVCISSRSRASKLHRLSRTCTRSSTNHIGGCRSGRSRLWDIYPISSIFRICTIFLPVQGRTLLQPSCPDRVWLQGGGVVRTLELSELCDELDEDEATGVRLYAQP